MLAPWGRQFLAWRSAFCYYRAVIEQSPYGHFRERLAMSLLDRIESLKAKHQDLEAQLEEEKRRPLPDEVVIHELKKQKLRIKDELAQLSTR
jgi:hypothetical protein